MPGSGFRRNEAPGQDGFVVVGGVCRRQSHEEFAQVVVGLDVVCLRRFDERVEVCAGLGAGDGVGEEPVLATDHERAERVFTGVVVCALQRHG